jgi:hypothetical protein
MPQRGDVWEVTGQRRRSVLVVSHGMYNDQPLGRSAKTGVRAPGTGVVDSQMVMDVNNALFKILSTS